MAKHGLDYILGDFLQTDLATLVYTEKLLSMKVIQCLYECTYVLEP
jgi:hypothetical protein